MEYTHNFKHLGNLESMRPIWAGMTMRRVYRYFNIEKCKVFLETGTFEGGTVEWADLQGHYEKMYSIELETNRYNFCSQKFIKNKNIEIMHGDTLECLPKIIKEINQPTLIYLDAHYNTYPIVEESTCVLDNFYDLDNLVVCIDDERLFTEELKQATVNLYSKFGFVDSYLDDSMVFCRNHWFRDTTI